MIEQIQHHDEFTSLNFTVTLLACLMHALLQTLELYQLGSYKDNDNQQLWN